MRLLVVLTYRLTELLLSRHPFHQVKLDLQSQGACRELLLSFLDRPDVDKYLALAFANHDFPADFAALIHSHTEGNPLFMVDLLRYLRERGVLAEKGGRWSLAQAVPDLRRELPESVRSMIRRKLDLLEEPDRRLLAAASVEGPEFDSAVVARALELEPAEVEERLQVLDQVYGLVRLVREQEFPDHTLTQRYAFVHVLYQNALYHTLPPTRRAGWSAAMAQTLLEHHGEQSGAVAAELGCLFEAGRDFLQASRQFLIAARNAGSVFAHQEAVALARRGLRLLDALPESPERAAQELPLQMTLGLQLQVTQGFAAPEVERTYIRARELCRQCQESPPLYPVFWGLWLFYKVRSELRKARIMADELMTLAQELEDPDLEMQSQQALAVTTLCRGEFTATQKHMEQGTALYDPQRHSKHAFLFGQDPGVACLAFGGVALWFLGHPDQAEWTSRQAVRLGRELSQPSTLALALHFAAMLHQCRREPALTLGFADEALAIATEHGFSFWMAGSQVMRGWALAESGASDAGIVLMRQGLEAWHATGSVTYLTYFLGLLAEVLGKRGQMEEACSVLDEALALVDHTEEGLYEAELHRLRGHILLGEARSEETGRQVSVLSAGEEYFTRALAIARGQNALSLELRAVLSLARLASRSGRPNEALQPLEGVLARFTEGLDTADLKEARELLQAQP
jgi:predicted ATPase